MNSVFVFHFSLYTDIVNEFLNGFNFIFFYFLLTYT